MTSRLVTAAVLLLLVGCASPIEPAAPTASSTAADMAAVRADDTRESEAGSEPALAAEVESHPDTALPVDTYAGTHPQRSSPAPRQVADPVEVEIPTIDVAAEVVDLGLNDDRTLEVPSDFDLAGWYTGRPPPGAIGPAIIVGHVDSRDGPAVFYRLPELTVGDEVLVHRADASTARFTVDRVEHHAKDEFPTDAVYGNTDDAALRLITCGGSFDRGRRSYDDNVVVFASLTPP